MRENKTRRGLRNASFQKKFGKWLAEAGALCLLTCLICSHVLALGRVPTESMEPTIKSGQKIIGSRLNYLFSKPGRGDIIAFTKNTDGIETPLCKRIIGIPGDTLRVGEDGIYVNNKKIGEETADIPPSKPAVYHVPEKCYFVMGDNGRNSRDSRHWPDPYIKEENIIAKVILII